MTNVQLPGAEDYGSHMAMHTSTANTDISLAREFRKHISDSTWAHGLFYHIKGIKCASKRKWSELDYHIQDKNMCHTYQLKCSVQELSSRNFHFLVRMQDIM